MIILLSGLFKVEKMRTLSKINNFSRKNIRSANFWLNRQKQHKVLKLAENAKIGSNVLLQKYLQPKNRYSITGYL